MKGRRLTEQADDEMTTDETVEFTDEELAAVPDDDDALPTPYTEDFDGVQDPEADPAAVALAEKRDGLADEAADLEGGTDA